MIMSPAWSGLRRVRKKQMNVPLALPASLASWLSGLADHLTGRCQVPCSVALPHGAKRSDFSGGISGLKGLRQLLEQALQRAMDP